MIVRQTKEELRQAITDAYKNFEFERLKEFGIRVQKKDRVFSFNHRGNITEVEKHGHAILFYLKQQKLEQYIQ